MTLLAVTAILLPLAVLVVAGPALEDIIDRIRSSARRH